MPCVGAPSTRPPGEPGGAGKPVRVDGCLAITNVNVLPMTTSAVLLNHDVVIESGRITRVAPHEHKPIPEYARVIDGGGGYLLPGLADLHVHLTDPQATALYLANGVTVVRNMWGTPASLALRDRVAKGELPGPQIVTTSPIIDGRGPSATKAWPGTALLERPEDALPLVRRFAARGYDQIKAYQFLGNSQLRALGNAAVRMGLPMTGHCPSGLTYEEVVDSGMACFEHLVGIEQGHLEDGFEMPSPSTPGNRFAMVDEITAYHLDFNALERLGDYLAAHDVRCCPTIVVRQGIDAIPEEAREHRNCQLVPPAVLANWENLTAERRRDRPGSLRDWVALGNARTTALLRVIATFSEAGVPLLVGTDAPQPWVLEGYSIHDELQNFLDAGLNCYAALSCATREAARFLGEERSWGTVLPGRRGDLVLVESNPLESLNTLRQPKAVLANGWLLDARALETLVEGRRTAAHCAPDAPAPQAAPPGKRLVTSGELTELSGDQEIAVLRFRYWLGPDEYAADGQITQQSTWNLTPALLLSSGECRTTSPLGTETLQLSSLGADCDMRLTAVDGNIVSLASELPAPVPGASFVRTLWPLLLSQGERTDQKLAVVDLLSGDLVEGTATAARVADRAADGAADWRVESVLPGELDVMDLRVDDRGVPVVIGRSSHLGWRELRIRH